MFTTVQWKWRRTAGYEKKKNTELKGAQSTEPVLSSPGLLSVNNSELRLSVHFQCISLSLSSVCFSHGAGPCVSCSDCVLLTSHSPGLLCDSVLIKVKCNTTVYYSCKHLRAMVLINCGCHTWTHICVLMQPNESRQYMWPIILKQDNHLINQWRFRYNSLLMLSKLTVIIDQILNLGCR